MDMFTRILIWAVGIAALVLIITVIVAVLQVSGEYDDLEDLIRMQAKEGLKQRYGEAGEVLRIPRGSQDNKRMGAGEERTFGHDTQENGGGNDIRGSAGNED